MAFAIKATIQAVQSFLEGNGYVKSVSVGEPKRPPTEEMAAAIFMTSVEVTKLTLKTTIELHIITVRLYVNITREPTEDIEFELADVVSKVSSDLLGDFDLGETIQNVDAGGVGGSPLQTQWGYEELGGTNYRIADILVPLIVNDSATTTA